MKYHVWYTTYGAYDDPDIPSKWIVGPMSFEAAWKQCQVLGFGYCVKESA